MLSTIFLSITHNKYINETQTEGGSEMKKRMFQVFDEMNLDDTANGTSKLKLSNTLISANKVKQGGSLSFGVDEATLMDIIADNVVAVVVIVDKEDYFKRKDAEPQQPKSEQPDMIPLKDAIRFAKWVAEWNTTFNEPLDAQTIDELYEYWKEKISNNPNTK